MSDIKEILELAGPAIDKAIADITIIPSVQVMTIVRDHIMVKTDCLQDEAARIAIAMKVNVNDESDVEAAAEILCKGVDMIIATVEALAGYCDREAFVEGCRALTITG